MYHRLSYNLLYDQLIKVESISQLVKIRVRVTNFFSTHIAWLVI